MKRFYMVWNENREPPRVRHDSFEKAKAEADRIATIHPGDKVHILVSVGHAVKRETSWEQHSS